MRFILIDRITKWEIGTAAEAIKNVSLSEDFFDDHFPRRPLMPGVLIVEGMVQLAALLLETTCKERQQRDVRAVLAGVEQAKFRDMVLPGDSLRYRVEVTALNDGAASVAAQAFRDEQVIAAGNMDFTLLSMDASNCDTRRAKLLTTWMQSPR